MKTFTSNTVRVNKSAQEVYSFLSDFNNFGQLMPPEISNWQSTTQSCSFTISGMADLSMAFGKCEAHHLITMKSEGKNPFEYTLETKIQNLDASSADVHLVFNADLNPMLAMAAGTALNNFVNLLADKLQQTLNNSH
jgi:carbon monoxide dehydrogenase subunit G